MSRLRASIPLREDLVELAGYHSPQVSVEVRLNTNESPFPPPASWLEELVSLARQVEYHRYPDRGYVALRSAVAAHHGVEPEMVFCANGSNEAIQCLLLAYGGPGRTAAVFEPTYALHSHISRLTGTAVHRGWRDGEFAVTRECVDSVLSSSAPAVTFFCSPNNPTGRSEDPEVVGYALASAPGLVVVDEAYGQFGRWSALDLMGDAAGSAGERLVVLRTFSKTWSMAACRLGYLIGPPEVVAACDSVALPYHLNSLTQAAGIAALAHVEEMEERVALIIAERERIERSLTELDVETWSSDANFLLFRPRSMPARVLWEALVEESVLLRDCSSWPGLEGCLRVTVGTAEENTRFLRALARILHALAGPTVDTAAQSTGGQEGGA